MAKSSIRKTDPADTTAPAKRRRTASDTTEGATVKAPRPRRKTDSVVAAAAVAPAAATIETGNGTNGHVELVRAGDISLR